MVPRLTPLEHDTRVWQAMPGRCETCGAPVEMREVAPLHWVWCDPEGAGHECANVSVPRPA